MINLSDSEFESEFGVTKEEAKSAYKEANGSAMKFARAMKNKGVSLTDAKRIKDEIKGSWGESGRGSGIGIHSRMK